MCQWRQGPFAYLIKMYLNPYQVYEGGHPGAEIVWGAVETRRL